MGSITYDIQDLLNNMNYYYDEGSSNQEVDVVSDVGTELPGSTVINSTISPTTIGSVPIFPFDEPEKEDTGQLLINVFRLLICVLGIIGNFFVIFVILVLKEFKKSVAHWYVLQLAIADSLFLLTLPFRVVEDMHNEWIFSPWMCKAKETLLFLNYYSSIIFLTVMSIDRYIAVCRPNSSTLQRFRSPYAACILTTTVWSISICLCIPVMLYSGVYGIKPSCRCQYQFPDSTDPTQLCLSEGYEEGTKPFETCVKIQEEFQHPSCLDPNDPIMGQEHDSYFDEINELAASFSENDVYTGATELSGEKIDSSVLHQGCHYYDHGSGFKSFLLFLFIGMFLLPFVVIAICYSLIVARLQRCRFNDERTTFPGSLSSKEKVLRSVEIVTGNRHRTRVTIMCGCLVLAFLICWLPFHSVHLAKMKGIHGSPGFCGVLLSVVSLVAYSNSALNPFLYGFTGSQFGKRIKLALSEVRHCGRNGTIGGQHKRDHNNKDDCTSENAATKILKENEVGIVSDSEDTKQEEQRLFVQGNHENIEMQLTSPVSCDHPPESSK